MISLTSHKRRFGQVRRLPSGRYQARYLGRDGALHRAPTTFAAEHDADVFLATVEAELRRGTWFDVTAGDVRLDVYAPRWIAERPVELQPRTLEIYDMLLRKHVYPSFGAVLLSRIASSHMRTWHTSLRSAGVGQVTVAKAYRLLKAILTTAVDDELIAENPCQLRNAGVERTPERKPPSIEEVERIAEAIEPRYERLIEHETGKDLDGYVWGVKWQVLYPGMRLVDDSETAARWAQEVSVPFHEALIEANGHRIELVFSDLAVTAVAPGYAPFTVTPD